MKIIRYIAVLYLFFTGYTAYPQNAGTADTTVSFKVFGACGQCKQRIQKSLKIKGVRSASWDVETKMLTVSYTPSIVSIDQLYETVVSVGHDTEKKKASDDVYKALPECCHYREMADESQIAMLDTTTNQNVVKGIVVETSNGQTNLLAGASIFWAGTDHGTVTNPHGEFWLEKHNGSDRLIISYAGFKSDTVSINGLQDIQITLSKKENLTGIVVTARARTTFIDAYNPFRIATITKKELLKAACCNLSESFETNPSVDVSYNDAATGSKQIQLLGLAGIYTQLTVENLPGPRGIATPLGLNSIAGP
ncbi:MAG: carboxypeptidase-like regulatory domain-containing protein, partial [Flavisolibacter sp.]|nr:carboxypeptidase-like regulatory domain-containing protein [Flavisolibacter sp.]